MSLEADVDDSDLAADDVGHKVFCSGDFRMPVWATDATHAHSK